MGKSKHCSRGILVAVPPERAAAPSTLWKLCRAGLWKCVVIQRDGDRVRVRGFSERRVLLLWGGLAGCWADCWADYWGDSRRPPSCSGRSSRNRGFRLFPWPLSSLWRLSPRRRVGARVSGEATFPVQLDGSCRTRRWSWLNRRSIA